MRLSMTAGRDEVPTGVGSKILRLLTTARIESTGIQRQSGREKTSVQKTGGVVSGSEGPECADQTTVGKNCKRAL